MSFSHETAQMMHGIDSYSKITFCRESTSPVVINVEVRPDTRHTREVNEPRHEKICFQDFQPG